MSVRDGHHVPDSPAVGRAAQERKGPFDSLGEHVARPRDRPHAARAHQQHRTVAHEFTRPLWDLTGPVTRIEDDEPAGGVRGFPRLPAPEDLDAVFRDLPAFRGLVAQTRYAVFGRLRGPRSKTRASQTVEEIATPFREPL